ncbi:hypothetical protein KC726_01755 [Candidatus Woesebacteria bacterium]|nr:hypothetical protein [Candidatus Woesebacteria bacterium]
MDTFVFRLQTEKKKQEAGKKQLPIRVIDQKTKYFMKKEFAVFQHRNMILPITLH